MKHFLWLLALLAAAPAWGAPNVISMTRSNSVTGATITFLTGDVADSSPIGVSGYCTVRYQQASGDDAALYAVASPTTVASSGTLLVTFTASTTPASPAYGFTSSTGWVKAKATDATAGGSVMTIECAPQVGAGSGATQPSPSTFQDSIATWAQITDPAIATYGYGIEFGNLTEFINGKTYNGGSTDAIEPDNQLGVFYNKALNEDPDNIYEHAFDKSWEMSYYDSATDDQPWVEENWDVYAPDMSATLTSIGGGFNPAVGSYVTFSGGGTGRVLAWSSPTLTWRQNYGKTAAGETVAEAATPTDTATLGTPAVSATYQHFRPSLHVWRTVTGKASHQWSTEYGGPITVKMQGGGMIVNSSSAPQSTLEVYGANRYGRNILGTLSSDTTSGGAAADGYPAVYFEYQGDEHTTSGNANGNLLGLRMDYTSIPDSSPDYALDYGKTLFIQSPLQKDVAADVYGHYGIFIQSQKSQGVGHTSAIYIDSQDCNGNVTCASLTDGWSNNVDFIGGNWSTGHLAFWNSDPHGSHDGGDHIWRDDTNERFRISTDDAPDSETDGRMIEEVVASGTRAMSTTIINAGACDTTDVNITATGAASTDRVSFSPNADPGATNGRLIYSAYAGTNVVSFRVCNPTAGNLTPAAMTVNWAVIR